MRILNYLRFKGSTEGAGASNKEAAREHYRAVQWRSKWEPEMASLVSVLAALAASLLPTSKLRQFAPRIY